MEVSKSVASDNLQPDLLYMDSVLVSTGRNQNDDVFLPSEMWKARSSPILKPVDWEHNTGKEIGEQTSHKSVVADNQIIGVMYNSYIALKDGSVLTEATIASDGFQVPSQFDIINQAVIYKYLFPRTAARIIRDAKAGKLFVSMEAWFNDYDYQVGNKIVARNEETAFLDTHLRAYGGTGKYKDVRVGRVLRNIVFGGIGVVSNPANKESIIQSFTNANTNLEDEKLVSNVIGNLTNDTMEVIEIMASEKTQETAVAQSISVEDYKEVVKKSAKAELELEAKDAELGAVRAQVESLNKTIEDMATAFESGKAALADVLGDSAAKLAKVSAEDYVGALADVIKEKLSAFADLNSKLAEATAKIGELETEKRSLARMTAIADMLAEFISDPAALAAKKEKIAKATQSLSDEDFQVSLADTKELLSLAVDKEKKAKEKEDKMEESEASAEDGVTDETVLDSVRSTASVAAGSESVVSQENSNDGYKSLAAALLQIKKN